MSDTIETKIDSALFGRLATLTLPPTHQIAWPTVNMTPTGQHLRVDNLWNDPRTVTLGDAGKNRYVGLFQVSVAWPVNLGAIGPADVAGAIAAHFKRGTVMTHEGINVRVVRPPLRLPAFTEDNTWYVIPVRVPYQADAANPS